MSSNDIQFLKTRVPEHQLWVVLAIEKSIQEDATKYAQALDAVAKQAPASKKDTTRTFLRDQFSNNQKMQTSSSCLNHMLSANRPGVGIHRFLIFLYASIVHLHASICIHLHPK